MTVSTEAKWKFKALVQAVFVIAPCVVGTFLGALWASRYLSVTYAVNLPLLGNMLVIWIPVCLVAWVTTHNIRRELKGRPERRDGVAVFLALTAPLPLLGLVWSWFVADACFTETRTTLTTATGLNVYVLDTYCDTVAKDQSTNIYVAEAGSWRRSLLFKFDGSVPSIDVARDGRIEIAAQNVSFIWVQKAAWHGHAVTYRLDMHTVP